MAVSVVTLVRLFLLLVSLELLAMAALAWQRRKRAPETWVVLLLLVAAGIYALGYSQQIAQTTLAGATFWKHMQYLGIPWLPALWVMLVREHNRMPSRAWLLFSLSALVFVAELTNGWHGLYTSQMHMVARLPFSVMVYRREPMAWFNLAYLYSALSYSAWIYLSRFRGASELYRKQSLCFVASSMFPLAGYIAYLGDWSPWGLDLAPVAMSISAALAYFAVIRLEFFDMVPLAHSLVFANMRDAVLVTDLEFRLVDMNAAAQQLLPDLSACDCGCNIAQRLGASSMLRPIFQETDRMHQVNLAVQGEIHTFEVRVLALHRNEQQQGWSFLWADVTAHLQLMRELRRYAETDELTGLANRRALFAAMERETAQARRKGDGFGLILIDVDYFKQINDRFGHSAGDRVLKAVACSIEQCLRQDDIFSRFGGDEFAILLPGTERKGAVEVAERICTKIAGDVFEVEGTIVPVTVSIGASSYNPEWAADRAQLIGEADEALYRAKAAGRNRVASAEAAARARDLHRP
ncbi:MAG: diguanylate cyclase [Terracidiphilus sp.]|nr:diguanylate cyclase [Terracidiphilus sp.]